MFAGIVEAHSKIKKICQLKSSLRIQIDRPARFNDIKIGDSISTNGVCLTVEAITPKMIQFCLGVETLKVLGPQISFWQKYPLNLERSLQLGARVHGHLVTGHVDASARITKTSADGECWQLQVDVPKDISAYFWKKGSVCLNGVSLTVNQFLKVGKTYQLQVCLIPETMKATNLTQYQVTDYLNIEADYLAKAYIESRVRNEKEFK